MSDSPLMIPKSELLYKDSCDICKITNLPLILINTENEEEPMNKERYIQSKIIIYIITFIKKLQLLYIQCIISLLIKMWTR